MSIPAPENGCFACDDAAGAENRTYEDSRIDKMILNCGQNVLCVSWMSEYYKRICDNVPGYCLYDVWKHFRYAGKIEWKSPVL